MFRRIGSRVLALTSLLTLAFAGTAVAQQAPVNLGLADSYAVLGGSEVTNSGATLVFGNLGLSPGSLVSGFGGPPNGTVFGETHIADSVANEAKGALGTAHTEAAGRGPAADIASGELGDSTLLPGVYNASSALGLTGNVTLNALGNPDAVFIIQVGSQLTTATDSSVSLIGSAQACNVYWQVGSLAALGTRTDFKGTIMAATAITVGDGAVVDGRLLAGTAEVTLLNDTITRSDCVTPPTDDGTTPGGGDGGGGGAGTVPGAGTGTGTGSGAGGAPGPDSTGPGVRITGPRGILRPPARRSGPPRRTVCTSRNFTASVRLRDRSKISRVKVYLDGKLLRSTRLSKFSLRIKVRGLKVGAHRITVVARDRAGNRSVTKRRFARCALVVAAPRFTG